MLLEPRLLERLERLSLNVNRPVAGMHPGEHRSSRLGSSLDFADWRPYTYGDDYRRIDYQIFARLDRLVVKLYQAEEELNLRVILDASTSMGFHGKLDQAKKVAAVLTYIAAIRRNRARLWAVDGSGPRPSPWARSREAAHHCMDWLEDLEAEGEAKLGSALGRIAASGGLPGLTVVITDLLDEGWEATIRQLAGPGGDSIVIHVLSEPERDPGFRGDLMLVDAETNSETEVSVSDHALRSYKRRVENWLKAVSSACLSRGILYINVDPEDDLEDVLLGRLMEARVLT